MGGFFMPAMPMAPAGLAQAANKKPAQSVTARAFISGR
jgi:hypothetical protein